VCGLSAVTGTSCDTVLTVLSDWIRRPLCEKRETIGALIRAAIIERLAAGEPYLLSDWSVFRGGRWNSAGKEPFMPAQTYAGAMLEVLVHANLGVVHRTQAGVSAETVTGAEVEGWAADDLAASGRFGDQWLDERRSAVLLVPSVGASGQGGECSPQSRSRLCPYRSEQSRSRGVGSKVFLGRAEIGKALFRLNGASPAPQSERCPPIGRGEMRQVGLYNPLRAWHLDTLT
jgi:RES domain